MSNVQQLSDVDSLRQRARQNVENGAVTEGYSADRETILRLLNESLATELVCVLRYKRHYYMATGLKASVAAAEFLTDRIWRNLTQPIETSRGTVNVGASIGVVLIEPSSRVLSVDKLHDLADAQMYMVKASHYGGGVKIYRPGDQAPVPATPKPSKAESNDLPEPSR